MSVFTDCNVSHVIHKDNSLNMVSCHLSARNYPVSYTDPYQYIYNRDGKEHSISSNMLSSLFKTHGYCVDPSDKKGSPLNKENIENLKSIAEKYNDKILLETIKLVINGRVPSPRMINDNIMYETSNIEKSKYNNYESINQNGIVSILIVILHVGLYLAGWKGIEEPYISKPRTVYDIIRAELKISPLIQSLHNNPQYPLIKNFPIIAYFKGNLSKAYVVDELLNIDQCLNKISIGMNKEYPQLATYLISTVYYYTSHICNHPIPMIEPFILSS